MKIWQQITKETWCQHSGAITDTGEDLDCVFDPQAAAWCAIGWIIKNYNNDYPTQIQVEQELMNHLEESSVIYWNDASYRKYEDVYNAFKAIDR